MIDTCHTLLISLLLCWLLVEGQGSEVVVQHLTFQPNALDVLVNEACLAIG